MAETEDVLIGSVEKNQRESIKVQLSRFKGYNLAHLRVWAVNQSGETVPTKQGFGLQVGQLTALIEILQEARREAEAKGWL